MPELIKDNKFNLPHLANEIIDIIFTKAAEDINPFSKLTKQNCSYFISFLLVNTKCNKKFSLAFKTKLKNLSEQYGKNKYGVQSIKLIETDSIRQLIKNFQVQIHEKYPKDYANLEVLHSSLDEHNERRMVTNSIGSSIDNIINSIDKSLQ